MRKVLFLVAVHGDEEYSIPIMSKLAEEYPMALYGYQWVVGNPRALKERVRFTAKDLNRSAPGNPESPDYEIRRAAELVELSREFDLVIDIHGSVGECGITTITPLPTAKNLQLAAAVEISRNVIWYAPESELAGPIVQHTYCSGIEIECGPKNNPTIAKELYNVLAHFLEKNREGDILQESSNLANFYQVYGIEKGRHNPSLKDFQLVTLSNEESFFPYMANQYEGIQCYKMTRAAVVEPI